MVVVDGAGGEDKGVYGSSFLSGGLDIFCLFFRQAQSRSEKEDGIVAFER